jgi:6-phosphogluconolactonase
VWIAEHSEGNEPFRIALTGGTTPRAVYERLSEFQLRWNSWHVWWSDERLVPPEHEDSNERLAREALLSRVPVPEEQIHPLRSVDTDLPERFDLVLLGIGGDGHTASLYDGHTEELEDPGPVVYVPHPGMPPPHPRLTFSLAYVNAQPLAAFLVAGEGKRDILARVLAGDESLPAARVRARETLVLADRAAAPPP